MAVFDEDFNQDDISNKDVRNSIKNEEETPADGIIKEQSTDMIASLLQTQTNDDTKEDIKIGK